MFEYDFDDQTVRDLHKDAYGFRPSATWDANWKAMTPDQKQAVWVRMIDDMTDSIRAEDLQEAKAIEVLDQHIASAIECGAGDRKTALRWIFTDADQDLGYELYKIGIWSDRRANPLIKEISEALESK